MKLMRWLSLEWPASQFEAAEGRSVRWLRAEYPPSHTSPFIGVRELTRGVQDV